MNEEETRAAAAWSAELDDGLEDFRGWRDRIASTFPLDDMGDEPRLLEAFNAAFVLGFVRAHLAKSITAEAQRSQPVDRLQLCDACFERVRPREEISIGRLAPATWRCDGCSSAVELAKQHPHFVRLTLEEWAALRASRK